MSTDTCQKLTVLANQITPERRRAEAMGFVFGRIGVTDDPMGLNYILRAEFRCVCGTGEFFVRAIDADFVHRRNDDLVAREFDVAFQLRSFGSFSRRHLIADGFDPERVDEIIEKGERWDEQKRRDDAIPYVRWWE